MVYKPADSSAESTVADGGSSVLLENVPPSFPCAAELVVPGAEVGEATPGKYNFHVVYGCPVRWCGKSAVGEVQM